MPFDEQEVEELFFQARRCSDADARREFVTQNCRGRPDLRERLQQLLDGADKIAGFLDVGDDREEQLTADFPASIAPIPQVLGDFEILEEIDRGGMGIVYKARQKSLNRIVAVKLIRSGHLAEKSEVARFHAEAESAAKLSHPNIVPIYEVGEFQGQHYFAMAYVKGTNLATWTSEGPIDSRRAAEILLRLANAISVAHAQGVVHRDLKPANILMEESGEPKITDFGLAKQLEAPHRYTATGQILGTPAYMSPEQARGRPAEVGPAADVYGLGAILFELLTARPPFQGETRWETLQQVLEHEPVPPRLLHPTVPRDLETICLKCLEKQPGHRYASAADLAADLRRFLDGDRISASSINLLDRISRVLSQSRHEDHLRGWGWDIGLVLMGLIILTAHIVSYILVAAKITPMWSFWLPRIMMFLALLGLLRAMGRTSLLAVNAVERMIWVVAFGYILGTLAFSLILAVSGQDPTAIHASCAVLGGFAFVVLGAHVWGGGYLVGLSFFLAAPALAARPDLSPLGFGLLWFGGLSAFGWHDWHIHRAPPESREIR